MEEENTCICLALVTSGNSQTTTKCLLLEDANWTIFPESKEHRTGLHAAQLPAGRHALHHQVTDENNLEMLSRGKPLHGFSVLFATSHVGKELQLPFPSSVACYYLKKHKFCSHQTDHLNLKSTPPHAEVMEGSRSAALFMTTHNLWVQWNWRTKLVTGLIRLWALNLTAIIRKYFVLDFLWKLQRWIHLAWRGPVASSVK